MVPVSVAPANQYADTPSGIPDPTTAGPSWIQIGTEGGFTPAPVVIPPKPIGYNLDPAYFNFGIVNQHSLFLMAAERSDVVVDFSAFAGKTLILYNDSPAPVPAGAAPYDYYTGDGNLVSVPGVAEVAPIGGFGTAAVLFAVTAPAFFKLGSEFMPPLYEEAMFYMPSTMPGISIGEAQRVLQVSDRLIKSFPEVDRVLGKAGRAETSTDPAPLSMLETVITLKSRSQWRHVPTWYSSWAPEFVKPLLRHITPDTISPEQLVDQLDASLQLPGVSNAWTMPIKARIDMLSTGIRTPVGLKIHGDDLEKIELIGSQLEQALRSVEGTRSVFAERTAKGYFLDFD